MANLLPILDKKIIRKEYRIRVAVVASLLISVLVFIAGVLLVPSYILSSFKFNSSSSQLEVEKKKISDATEGVDPIRIAKEVNEKLVVLEREGSLLPLSYDVATVVVGHKPSRVKINSIYYDRDMEEGRVNIKGLSKDRETLLVFLQSLEAEEIFTSVELPISSFVEGQDIEFTIRVGIDHQEINNEEINNESR